MSVCVFIVRRGWERGEGVRMRGRREGRGREGEGFFNGHCKYMYIYKFIYYFSTCMYEYVQHYMYIQFQ